MRLQPTRTNRARLKFSVWCFEPQKDVPEELERKLDYLLDCLAPYQEKIAKLASTNYVSINIAYYGYKSWMGGWGLNAQQIRQISTLGCEIDFDLYAYGLDLPE
nr:DUF4279 domain-containing protein [Hyella patelloides]